MATTRQSNERSDRGVVDHLFFEHPRSLGMSWGSHGAGAVKVGLQLIGAGFAALVHAAVPGIFGHTASNIVIRIHDHIQNLGGKSPDDA